jgi:outer membrane protein
MKKTIISAALLLGSLSLQAQQSVSLADCHRMALQNNAAIVTAKNSIVIAEEQKKEARTQYFPTVSASAQAFQGNRDLVAINMAGQSMSFVKNGVLGGVTAMQPVFSGGRIVNGNKLADLGLQSSKTQLARQENEVGMTTEQYYWNVVMLQEQLKTIAVVQEQLSALDKDVSASVKAGVTNRNGLLQVQLRENDVESQRVRLANALSVSKLTLAQYIGLDGQDVNVNFSLSTDSLPQFPVGLKVNASDAVCATPEYQLMQQGVDQAHLQRKMQLGSLLPTVAVGAGITYNKMMDNNLTRGMALATVSVPISGWWGGSHALKRLKTAEANAQEQLRDNSQRLVIGINQRWTEVENAYAQLRLARKSIEQSQENLRLNRNLYDAGTSSMTDLMQAQTQYQQARNQFVDAYAALQSSIYNYKVATNQK